MNRFNRIFVVCLFFIGMFLTTGCSPKHTTKSYYAPTKYTSSARHKSTMRSYVVRGKRYYPKEVEKGHVSRGIASWYGPNFHGKQTSNGEIYNMHARTAAHKTFPMDTIASVHNLDNGKNTIVRINDRGPFVRGRIIDCSYYAGKELGLDKSGIANVKVRVLGIAGQYKTREARHSAKKRVQSQAKRVLQRTPVMQERSDSKRQVGAFSNKGSAYGVARKYANKYPEHKVTIQYNNGLYRVYVYNANTQIL
ncbi:MAG: Rare lipoprotein A precursor [uncultured Sulfurovum sp.]|uniref:Probable endolytic peptidoglycan transglycosylase RlpA n=1 Tax=uncultured Sulfurovum sp. TaxID=269237 RepID=A0A6S6U475_9BACT|nr:MAG: Rare lipoprotein A precursor [uncultured Sulfurovum sp.]